MGRLTVVGALFAAKSASIRHRLGAWLGSWARRSTLLASRARELRAAESRLRAIAENSHDLVVDVDLDGRIAYVSPNIREILGLCHSEVEGRLDLDRVHPDDRAEARALGITRSHFPERRLLRVRHRDGAWRWLDARSSSFEDEFGGERRLILCRDVTDSIEQADREREQAHAVSHSRRMESVGRLASVVAHELNNLMTVVTLNLELLRRQHEGLQPESMDRIQQAADETVELTRRVRSFARPGAAGRRRFDLNVELASVGHLLELLVDEDVSVEISLDPDAGAVEGDPSELLNAVLGLGLNASDAMRGAGRISIATRRLRLLDSDGLGCPPGDYACLSVRDTGRTIDEQSFARAFEPFLATQKATGATGSVAAARSAAAQHRTGSIHCEQQPGRAPHLEIRIPRSPESSRSSAALPPTDSPLRLRRSEPILVVDDQAHVRTAVANTLRGLGYQVREAESGERALEILEDPGVSLGLLVTDIVMPGLRGTELARSVRARRPGVRVLFVTAYADGQSMRHVTAADPVLAKPFTADALASAVGSLLGGGGAPAREVREESRGAELQP